MVAQRIIGLNDGKVVMDEPAKDLTVDYVRRIYAGYDQGLFFGPEIRPSTGEDIITWSEYK
jgi:ABC-type phosphate/phosphonate transport system ATPase subunit